MSHALTYHEPVSVSASERQSYLTFARGLARDAGERSLAFFRQSVQVEDKQTHGRFDPVTEADRLVESAVRDGIARAYPEHGLLGEEYGHQPGNGLTWVVDPIDGTRAFMTGMLHWGLLLALFNGKEPVIGVMYQPFVGEMFYGDGRDAWHQVGDGQARRLAVSGCGRLSDAVLASTDPRFVESAQQEAAMAGLEGQVKLTRWGGDCYVYAMLAMGYVDIATDPGLNPYDIQALVPIIRGAGGIVTTAEGSDPSLGGWVVACATRALHDQVLQQLRGTIA